MKRLLLIAMLMTATIAVSAQSNRTVETHRDQYGHVVGTSTTTTDSRGNKTTLCTRTGMATRPARARHGRVTTVRALQPTRTSTVIRRAQVQRAPATTVRQRRTRTATATRPVRVRPARTTTVAPQLTKTATATLLARRRVGNPVVGA